MSVSTTLLSRTRRALGTVVLCLGIAGAAHAQVYDFSTFLSGGGGGADPAKQRTARGAGAYICLYVSERHTPAGNSVQFMIRSLIPEPKSRIGAIVFDTGRHSNLFANLSVLMQSSNVIKPSMSPPQPHPFLPGFKPAYWIGVPHSRIDLPSSTGFKPGSFVVVAATLASGKSFADVINALNEGLNPATASTGLRVGVIAAYLNGGPPPGVGTINDDGGFVMTRAKSSLCGRG
jgi:hypothetical protein